MGVLNVTPDSFSDGGKYDRPEPAIEHALAMERAGADMIDVGGESTRPGSGETHASEELDRILPVLEGLRGRLKIPVSVDTRRSAVAELAIRAGAQIINDVSGLKSDARIAEVAAKYGVPLVLMHMRGEPGTMQRGPFARDVMREVMQGLRDSVQKARKAGVAKVANYFGSGDWLREELCAELRVAAKVAAACCARLSAAGGHFAQRISRSDARARWQTCSAGRANMGHGGYGHGEHFGRRTYRART